jgi:hypothetical protein
MAENRAGGFEYRGRTYRFRDASCCWESSSHELFIDAEGPHCALGLVGVPFPGASEVADLPGRAWEPDAAELALHADTFAEGGLDVGEKHLWIMGGRIECRRFDAGRKVLTINFRFTVLDEGCGPEDEADGVAHCHVIARPPWWEA